jgi:hypothetical protein
VSTRGIQARGRALEEEPGRDRPISPSHFALRGAPLLSSSSIGPCCH